ncbi:MAG: hypothetical protein R3B47_11785 [Bacteroidia bacterium]
MADRSFFYRFFETEPTVNFQLERNLRLSASYRYRNRLATDQPNGSACRATALPRQPPPIFSEETA